MCLGFNKKWFQFVSVRGEMASAGESWSGNIRASAIRDDNYKILADSLAAWTVSTSTQTPTGKRRNASMSTSIHSLPRPLRSLPTSTFSSPWTTLPLLNQTCSRPSPLWREGSGAGEEGLKRRGAWTAGTGHCRRTSGIIGSWRFTTVTSWIGTCAGWTRSSRPWRCSWARGRPSNAAATTRRWRRNTSTSPPSSPISEKCTTIR